MSLGVLSIGAHPPGSTHRVSMNIEMLHVQAFLDMSYVAFKVPSKEALPPGYAHTAPIDRDAPFTERSFAVSQSSWKMNPLPLQVPQ